jgi:hypothetical protein
MAALTRKGVDGVSQRRLPDPARVERQGDGTQQEHGVAADHRFTPPACS